LEQTLVARPQVLRQTGDWVGQLPVLRDDLDPSRTLPDDHAAVRKKIEAERAAQPFCDGVDAVLGDLGRSRRTRLPEPLRNRRVPVGRGAAVLGPRRSRCLRLRPRSGPHLLRNHRRRAEGHAGGACQNTRSRHLLSDSICCSRACARVSDRSCRAICDQRSPTFASRSAIVLSVNERGSTSPRSTSSHVHGADTGAPGFARTAYAAANVALQPLRPVSTKIRPSRSALLNSWVRCCGSRAIMSLPMACAKRSTWSVCASPSSATTM